MKKGLVSSLGQKLMRPHTYICRGGKETQVLRKFLHKQ